jgi:hypothetical protein
MDNMKNSKKQEKRIANLIGGMRTTRSGADMFDKGDVKAKHILMECKTQNVPKRVRSIRKEWLEKIEEQSFNRGFHFSALCIDFGDGEDFFVLNRKDFLELYECYVRLLEIEEGDDE